MNELEEARKIINEVDEQIAKLFEQRMLAVKKVLAYKQANNIAITDTGRERFVIEKNSQYIQEEELVEYYVMVLRNMIEVSKEYQKKLMSII